MDVMRRVRRLVRQGHLKAVKDKLGFVMAFKMVDDDVDGTGIGVSISTEVRKANALLNIRRTDRVRTIEFVDDYSHHRSIFEGVGVAPPDIARQFGLEPSTFFHTFGKSPRTVGGRPAQGGDVLTAFWALSAALYSTSALLQGIEKYRWDPLAPIFLFVDTNKKQVDHSVYGQEVLQCGRDPKITRLGYNMLEQRGDHDELTDIECNFLFGLQSQALRWHEEISLFNRAWHELRYWGEVTFMGRMTLAYAYEKMVTKNFYSTLVSYFEGWKKPINVILKLDWRAASSKPSVMEDPANWKTNNVKGETWLLERQRLFWYDRKQWLNSASPDVLEAEKSAWLKREEEKWAESKQHFAVMEESSLNWSNTSTPSASVAAMGSPASKFNPQAELFVMGPSTQAQATTIQAGLSRPPAIPLQLKTQRWSSWQGSMSKTQDLSTSSDGKDTARTTDSEASGSPTSPPLSDVCFKRPIQIMLRLDQ